MPNANYVCTVCSQTFTRRWRGNKHNIQLHLGNATIVRHLDYIIGRLDGRYQPGDPSLYRSKKLNPISREITHTNFEPSPVRQARSDIGNRSVGDFAQFQSPSKASSTELNDTIRENQKVASKYAKLKQLLEKNVSPMDARKAITEVMKCCSIRGNYEPLDIALDTATRRAKFVESRDYLSRS
jgi:hypothetical protein